MIKLNFPNSIPEEAKISKEAIEKIAEEVLAIFNLTNNYEIEIIFIDENMIRSLNKKYRNTDKPTDVLSFPQTIFKKSKLNLLGSIVICTQIVLEKDEDFEQVIKHSLLHLLGHDHEKDLNEWDEAAKKINCTF